MCPKSEVRDPKAERRPKPEVRILNCLRQSFGFRVSDFGLLSGLGLRVSGFIISFLAVSLPGFAQPRPYIGFVYPAGGQQGTTFQIRLGGQGLDEVSAVRVTGPGVSARVVENYRRLNNQEMQVLNEQLRILKRETMSESGRADLMAAEGQPMMSETGTNTAPSTNEVSSAESKRELARKLIDRIEKRTSEYVPNPASAAMASLVIVEVTIASDAEPAPREIRLVTLRGVSNPLGFHIGRVPEFTRKPMVSATQQVLGKEAQALRKRLNSEVEDRVTLPCTLNGQIASGEVNRYRFAARKGQHLVINALGRELVPFIADAVPGWFQPVLVLYDASGKEVAYADDYRFNPDPTLFYEVPRGGDYVCEIRDSIYRGREDFVYRITMGELPFITSVFPLGGRINVLVTPQTAGQNLQDCESAAVPTNAGPGITWITAKGRGLVSNRVPFAWDILPECVEQEPNNTGANAQMVNLPVIINGRINKPDDWDVFQFVGRSNETVVAEVQARRLGSPLDSIIKLTDASGKVIAFNDDHEQLDAGLSTHQADSYLIARLPADGAYFVHVGDTARQGGEEYGYRLRLSAPRPGFELRVVPSSLGLRAKGAGNLTVYAKRKDGFAGSIKLGLKDPGAGFSANPLTLSGTQTVAQLTIKTTLISTPQPTNLSIVGRARIGEEEIIHEAVPAEDRMQAFLWRQLVPATDLEVLVFDPAYQPPPKRILPPRSPVALATNAATVVNPMIVTNVVAGTNSVAATNAVAAAKSKFTKQQVAGRLKELKRLFEEGMLTDEFYNEKVAECEAEL